MLQPLPTSSDGVEALYAMGHRLLTQERSHPRRAAAFFRVMLLSVPSDERGWLGLGACHEELAEPEVALEIYRGATIAVPSSVRCHLAHARLLRERGDVAEASDAIGRAMAAAEDGADDELIQLAALERRTA
jgi:tetratricopeptide (TPR) repeat protein